MCQTDAFVHRIVDTAIGFGDDLQVILLTLPLEAYFRQVFLCTVGAGTIYDNPLKISLGLSEYRLCRLAESRKIVVGYGDNGKFQHIRFSTYIFYHIFHS